jgi:hypothetical protein
MSCSIIIQSRLLMNHLKFGIIMLFVENLNFVNVVHDIRKQLEIISKNILNGFGLDEKGNPISEVYAAIMLDSCANPTGSKIWSFSGR